MMAAGLFVESERADRMMDVGMWLTVGSVLGYQSIRAFIKGKMVQGGA